MNRAVQLLKAIMMLEKFVPALNKTKGNVVHASRQELKQSMNAFYLQIEGMGLVPDDVRPPTSVWDCLQKSCHAATIIQIIRYTHSTKK